MASHIRRRIVIGQLHEDETLPESRLLDEFGVSRPTLREAIRILESEGLVTTRRGGPRVREPTANVAARYALHVLGRGSEGGDHVEMSASVRRADHTREVRVIVDL